MTDEERIGHSLVNAGGNCGETQICHNPQWDGLAQKAVLHDGFVWENGRRREANSL